MGTIFSSTDVRGRIGESDTTEYIWNAGKAFAEWLPEGGNVVVIKSPMADASVARAFVEGLLLQGRAVVDAGDGDQSALIAAIDEAKAVGGALVDCDTAQNLVVITLLDGNASTVTAESGLNDINQLVESGNFLPAAEKGVLVSGNPQS